MSKRYSGKSFKDSNVNKKPKFSLKEKEESKKRRQKKQNSAIFLKIAVFIKLF